jgi:hypothetical protein
MATIAAAVKIPDWLSAFFHDGFASATVLGLGAFAMLVIVALVALVVVLNKSSPLYVFVIATLAVLIIVGLSLAFPLPRLLPARWVDTGMQADWGGKDAFYGAGEFPVYEWQDRKLCDDDHVGKVATCWTSRPSDPQAKPAGVPTNFHDTRYDWCAYKDYNVKLSEPDGRVPGRVYLCAHTLTPEAPNKEVPK